MEVTGLGGWLLRMEDICLRVVILKIYLEMDKLRKLRRMETLEEDRVGGRKSLHLIHRILSWEGVMTSYNQKMKMVKNIQKFW